MDFQTEPTAKPTVQAEQDAEWTGNIADSPKEEIAGQMVNPESEEMDFGNFNEANADLRTNDEKFQTDIDQSNDQGELRTEDCEALTAAKVAEPVIESTKKAPND